MRVLLVGMADSVHVARWLANLDQDTKVNIRILPSSPHRKIHNGVQALLKTNGQVSVAINPFLGRFSLPIWLLDRIPIIDGRLRAWFLRRDIVKFQPHIVHIMETQNGGYPALRAFESLERRSSSPCSPKVMLTLFGSDLFWFARFPRHEHKLRMLLPRIDYLAAECHRDLEHASKLGFRGQFLPLSPVAAGVAASQISEATSSGFSERRIVSVKGYGGRWGLGYKAIEALGGMPGELSGYKVVIHSAERSTIRAAKKYLDPQGIEYEIFRKHELSHNQMLELLAKSRIYIGLSRSDGLPASLLEAMSQGAFPIQTDSACTGGWITTGVTGEIVETENQHLVEFVATAIRKVMGNDKLVITAALSNIELVRRKYSLDSTSSAVRWSYQNLTNDRP